MSIRGMGRLCGILRAIRLREAIYRIFSNEYGNERVNPDDLKIFNEALVLALPHLLIISSPTAFNGDWMESSDALDQILWPVARSAGKLLTSKKLDRICNCADDRGCGYLFVDKESKLKPSLVFNGILWKWG